MAGFFLLSSQFRRQSNWVVIHVNPNKHNTHTHNGTYIISDLLQAVRRVRNPTRRRQWKIRKLHSVWWILYWIVMWERQATPKLWALFCMCSVFFGKLPQRHLSSLRIDLGTLMEGIVQYNRSGYSQNIFITATGEQYFVVGPTTTKVVWLFIAFSLLFPNVSIE